MPNKAMPKSPDSPSCPAEKPAQPPGQPAAEPVGQGAHRPVVEDKPQKAAQQDEKPQPPAAQPQGKAEKQDGHQQEKEAILPKDQPFSGGKGQPEKPEAIVQHSKGAPQDTGLQEDPRCT